MKRLNQIEFCSISFYLRKISKNVKKLTNTAINKTKKTENYFIIILNISLMMNFCNRIVNEIVIKQKQDNIYEYKVNMKMAMYLCRQFFRTKKADEKILIKDMYLFGLINEVFQKIMF